jgi:hypothetical protein
MYSAFLSNPAASPTLFGNFSPIIMIGLEVIFFFLSIQKNRQASNLSLIYGALVLGLIKTKGI